MGCGASTETQDPALAALAKKINANMEEWGHVEEELKRDNAKVLKEFEEKWFSLEMKQEGDSIQLSGLTRRLNTARQRDSEASTMTPSQSVEDFFVSFGLDGCLPVITALRLDWPTLLTLTEEDLQKEIGIESGIKRKQILVRLKELDEMNKSSSPVVTTTEATLSEYLKDVSVFYIIAVRYGYMYLTSPELLSTTANTMVESLQQHLRNESSCAILTKNMTEKTSELMRSVADKSIDRYCELNLFGTATADIYFGFERSTAFLLEFRANRFLCGHADDKSLKVYLKSLYDKVACDYVNRVRDTMASQFEEHLLLAMAKSDRSFRLTNAHQSGSGVSKASSTMWQAAASEMLTSAASFATEFAVGVGKELCFTAFDILLPGSGTLLRDLVG